MRIFKKVVLWSLTGLFSFLGFIFLVTGGILSALFATAFIVLIIPIESWQLKVKKIIKGKFKTILAIILAILFFVAVPSTDNESSELNMPQTSITEATVPSSDQVTELITDPITEPVTEPTTTKPQIEQTEPDTNPTVTQPTTPPETEPTKPTSNPSDHITETTKTTNKPTEPTTKPTSKPTEPTTEPTKTTSKPSQPATEPSKDNSQTNSDCDYVVNTNTNKFHHPECSSVKKIKDENRMDYHGSREELIEDGYKPCGNCDP